MMTVDTHSSQGVSNIAIVAIVAFVIVVLAFFFTAPKRDQYVMIGEPHGFEEVRYASHTFNRSDRLGTTTRTKDLVPPDVRESGLSEE